MTSSLEALTRRSLKERGAAAYQVTHKQIKNSLEILAVSFVSFL